MIVGLWAKHSAWVSTCVWSRHGVALPQASKSFCLCKCFHKLCASCIGCSILCRVSGRERRHTLCVCVMFHVSACASLRRQVTKEEASKWFTGAFAKSAPPSIPLVILALVSWFYALE